MRVTVCLLFLLVITAAVEAEPLAPGAVGKNGSCKAGIVKEASGSSLSFGEVISREPKLGRVGAPFSPNFASESSTGQCTWYQIIRYYTDATYAQQCGMQFFYCDGLVGSAGLCRTQFSTIQTCECWEEEAM